MVDPPVDLPVDPPADPPKIDPPVNNPPKVDPPKSEVPATDHCPKCYVPVPADKMGSHMYAAHQVDRRAPATPTIEPPPVVDKTKKDPPAKKRSRVSSSWFGERAGKDE